MGEGLRGSNAALSTLHWIPATPSTTHNQTGPLWCWLLSGWACARPRPLWVPPMTSHVRLESLLLPPQPPRAFSIRVLRLYFPAPEPWVSGLLSSPPFFPVYLCASVGPQGLLVVRLPAPFVPHSASLSPAMATRVLSAPAARLCPSYRSG